MYDTLWAQNEEARVDAVCDGDDQDLSSKLIPRMNPPKRFIFPDKLARNLNNLLEPQAQ